MNCAVCGGYGEARIVAGVRLTRHYGLADHKFAETPSAGTDVRRSRSGIVRCQRPSPELRGKAAT